MNTNVIVMSEAGKPIFARYGSSGEVARKCGLIQAIRTAVNGNNSKLGLGEIQSLQSKKLCIAFMTVGSITLVALSEQDTGDKGISVRDTETFCRLQLEYVYASIIFLLTTNIQKTFLHNPGFDLRSIVKSNDNLLRGILDDIGPEGNPGPFLVSSVQSCYPISYRVREKASIVLQRIAGKTEDNVAFALLIVGDRLLTVIQPSYRPHQLQSSDLHLIINFVEKHPDLISKELWVPMCLPFFNATGYLYAYTSCLDTQSKLTLVLVSPHNTTEQFQILRAASQKIRDALNVPVVSDSILTIVTDGPVSSSSSTSTTVSDVVWKRTSESFDNSSTTDEGFVNISPDMLRKESALVEEAEFLRQVRHSVELSSIDYIRNRYLNIEDSRSLIHFLFRFSVPVENHAHKYKKKQHSGCLSQCISQPFTAPFNDAPTRRRIWSNYQKLSLRLRLGSATVESSIDAIDVGMMEHGKDESGVFPKIGKHCSAIGLLESTPYNSDGLSYIVEGDLVFLAMNGKNFELYSVVTRGIPLQRAITIGSKLAREIILDEKTLFLSKPLTWKE